MAEQGYCNTHDVTVPFFKGCWACLCDQQRAEIARLRGRVRKLEQENTNALAWSRIILRLQDRLNEIADRADLQSSEFAKWVNGYARKALEEEDGLSQ